MLKCARARAALAQYHCARPVLGSDGIRAAMARVDIDHRDPTGDQRMVCVIVDRKHAASKCRRGGLVNAIAGSLMLTGLATAISAPLGILASVYLAEYGRRSRLAESVRFINDILLSAPSIVIGLFVYALFVAPFQHFSGWAGAIAL